MKAQTDRRRRVLVVDPDPRTGAYLSDRIRGTCDVRTALDPSGASSALRWRPHLVVVSAEMPGAEGVIDAVRKTRECAETQVGLVANQWSVERLAAARKRPQRADRFLKRPLDPGVIVRWLEGEPPEDPAQARGNGNGNGGAGRLQMLAREVDKLRKERERHVKLLAEQDRKIKDLKVRVAAQTQIRAEMAQSKELVSEYEHTLSELRRGVAHRDHEISELKRRLDAATQLGQRLLEQTRQQGGEES